MYIKREHGAAFIAKSVAAPATVSEEFCLLTPLAKAGKVGQSTDTQARRPALGTNVTGWAGLPGGVNVDDV